MKNKVSFLPIGRGNYILKILISPPLIQVKIYEETLKCNQGR
jgi:hypothetical protein